MQAQAIELEVLTLPPNRVPLPSHRHATPSGPWPWIDLESNETNHPPRVPSCSHEDCTVCAQWLGYPQSRFPNWTKDQVIRCKIAAAITDRRRDCKVYHVDVRDDEGMFAPCDRGGFLVTKDNERDFWYWLQKSTRPSGLRVRALFVKDLSGPVLQILGSSYNIEPFFFSSSLNWIPSRYEEEVHPGIGDHITITLTFLRNMPTPDSQASSGDTVYPDRLVEGDQIIDTQAPLRLSSENNQKFLFLDVLNVHLVRHRDGSTMISYHPDGEWRMTTAMDLQSRVRLIGESVYWQNIFKASKDPTFLLVAIFWHVVYAWDQALETLYAHISFLEAKVMETNDLSITRELHTIRAHLLHYTSLLEDFRKSVQFILDTPNPAMDGYETGQRERDHELLERECGYLLTECKRLDMSRKMQDMRVKNVMNLVFSNIKLNDSKRMQVLMEASIRNSEATRQIAYLLMLFRPADTVAECFRMNVTALNPKGKGSLLQFIEVVVPLTVASICLVLASRTKDYFTDLTALFKRKRTSRDNFN